MQGAQVQSLVGEIKLSHACHAEKKKKKKISYEGTMCLHWISGSAGLGHYYPGVKRKMVTGTSFKIQFFSVSTKGPFFTFGRTHLLVSVAKCSHKYSPQSFLHTKKILLIRVVKSGTWLSMHASTPAIINYYYYFINNWSSQ